MMCVLALVFISAVAHGQAPLFEGDGTLRLTIEAPMRELVRKRTAKPSFAGEVAYTDAAGQPHRLPVTVSTRGNSRLETCSFPPIRLEFAAADVAGSIFAGQKKLKMVTQCKPSNASRNWLLLEFGIYKAFNVITDASYRVRRLEVSYRDSDSKRWQRESPAFFIEDTDRMAARLGKVTMRPPEVKTTQYDPVALTRGILFQLLIGNTDFSVIRGPRGEGCCHNARIIAAPGQQDGWVVVPYDFDQAGLIDTEYALPDERLGISTVTRRLYRGFCWQNDYLADTIARFNERRDAVVAALLPEGLSKSKTRRARRYIDRFYEIINDPGELEKQLTNKCRGGVSIPVRTTRTRK
jgi:hypothetical protein